jgi:GNAT superfamily N-acetyltransferase
MSSDALHFESFDAVPPEVAVAIDAGLTEANAAAAPLHEVRHLACAARDAEGEWIGGAIGRTWGECCELQQIWVAPAQRGRGVARQLLRRFEAAAQARGCKLLYLETFSFQAPGFYRREGYTTLNEIAGFGHGIVKYLLMRRLPRPRA